MRENRLMKAVLAAVIAGLLTAASASAQSESIAISSSNSPPPTPDYSRQALLKFVSNVVEPPPPPEGRVQWHPGYVEFRALNMKWRILFLPFLAPLPGSVRGTVSRIPDAFSLTGTEIAQPPRTWKDLREKNKEMRRIERTERERAKLEAHPE